MQTELRNLRKGDVPIFLQDPDYAEEDQKAAKELGMTIVNGHFGFEEGWIQIDESTLVVDLHTTFPPLLQLAFEISRPAGILTVFPYKAGMLKALDKVFAPFSYTIFNLDDEPKPITVPGMGVWVEVFTYEFISKFDNFHWRCLCSSNYSANIEKIFREEYIEIKLNYPNLAQPENEEPGDWSLGSEPTFYLRKRIWGSHLEEAFRMSV